MAVKTLKVDLPAEIFDAQASVPLLHQVVVAQLAAARQGTHKTKNRGEVSGAGRKPFKQKGTGNARQGSIRAPHMTGGGVVHGPTPRNYAQRTPKKMIAAALRGALSDRARHGRIHVVETLVAGETPSTKAAKAALASITERKNVLVVIGRDEDIAALSARNLQNVHVLYADQLNTYDVLISDDVVFTKAAYDAFVTANQKSVYDVIIAPVVSEKSYSQIDEGKVTFEVAPNSNKLEIKQAIEKIFGVEVASVNTINRKGKRKRTRFGWGSRKDTKRAIVTLKDGHHIDIFGGPQA